jgi:hypothetical protein
MTPEEFIPEFYFDPAAPRAMGYTTNLSLVRDSAVEAVAVAAQLLDRETKQPSNKWIWLQMQPADALALAASILVHAREEGWPVRPDFLELVQQVSLSKKDQQH